MKLATFSNAANETPRLGLVTGDAIVDLTAVAGAPGSMAEYLAGGATAEAAVRGAAGIEGLPLADVTLHAPMPKPGKVLAIGLNYGDHIAESGMEPPKFQVWFNKQHNCINDPYGPINLPEVSDKLDYEAELCLLIGKRCKHVPRERAHEVIAGYF
ncbi:MAG: fumarylacetoacetate hydrolase family protein, partial [Pseudomonadota bacterium]